MASQDEVTAGPCLMSARMTAGAGDAGFFTLKFGSLLTMLLDVRQHSRRLLIVIMRPCQTLLSPSLRLALQQALAWSQRPLLCAGEISGQV